MFSNDKTLQNVADAVSKIMNEKLHPNQQKLDVHEPEKDKLTADDFKKLRAGKKVQEATAKPDFLDLDKDGNKKEPMKKASSSMKKEEAEQITEYKSTGGVYKHKGTYGTEKSVEAGYTDYDKENEMAKKLSKPAKKKYGARQNFVRSTRVNESFTEILSQYKEGGLKNLFESFKKEEQVLSEETQEETVQVEVTDFDAVNGVTIETIEERSMTEPEIKKKEEIVKSMKKGISGFKARYGDDAKSVMYATATKRAMGEEVEQIEEGTPEGYQRRDGKLIPKIHPTMTPHEHGYDYTMQSIEDAPSKAKIHSQHKEIVKDNPHPQGSKEHKDWEAGTNKAKADHLKDWS
jgi:hypothetical protein